MPTNLQEFLGDLDGGVFEQKISQALSDVAAGVILNGKMGEVKITLKLKQIEKSNQVVIEHTLGFDKPTKNGKTTEINTTTTPMYVIGRGDLVLFQQTQDGLFNSSKSED